MKKIKITILVAFLLLLFTSKGWAQPNPTTTGPIGSQIAIGLDDHIKYWNGTVWVAIPSGLPGQTLVFNNGVSSWVNNPNGITTNSIISHDTMTAVCGGNIASSGGSHILAKGVCWGTSHNPTLSNSHTSDAVGVGSFTSNVTGLIASNTYYVRAYATNSVGTSYGNEDTILGIGKNYAGGIIFYLDSTRKHGMVCSLRDTASFTWGCINALSNPISTSSAVGTGLSNTNAMIANSGYDNAAGICKNYSDGGYHDWYLPSSDELTLIYNNLYRKGKGNFTIAEFLWSSSSDGGCDPSGAPPQYIHCYAWCMEFLPEACTPQYWYRFLTRSVRPVRMF